MTDQIAKSLRWLANQFPAVEMPKDDTDRISTCIHLYCAAGADAIDTLTAQLAALQAENAEKDKEIERVEAERDAAQKEIERMKDIMRQHGIMVIPSKHPGGRPEWNISRGAQGAE